jgi:hypothetical protein
MTGWELEELCECVRAWANAWVLGGLCLCLAREGWPVTSWSVVGWSTGRVRSTLGKGLCVRVVGEEVFALGALRTGTGTGTVVLRSQSADPSPQEPATQSTL